jgi:flagellar biosynthesis GTPase FlhF
MNIKTFRATSTHEALKMVKEHMGPEAVILKTRTLGSAELGAGHGGQKIEMTAAVDYDRPRRGEHRSNPSGH